MAMLMVLGIPAFNMIKGSRDLAQTASDIAGTLEAARSYAMAQNTYVFVGIAEVNATNAVSAQNQSEGIGRLVLAVVASRDGTNNYDASGQWRGDADTPSNLEAVSRLKVFNKAHLADFYGKVTTSGPMAARVELTSESESLGSEGVGQGEVFRWPPGSGNTQYTFYKVIQFDPRGSAALQEGLSPGGSVQWMEIGLQECRGIVEPAPVSDIATGNIAVIQVDGVTGAIRTYRP
jgi:hypothetical protein